MTTIYKTKASAKGGRDGLVESDDGNIKLNLSIPKSLGGPGLPGATNPEQLFAAGYAACFSSAIQHSARLQKILIPNLVVNSEIGLIKIDTGFGLVVALEAVFSDLDLQTCELLTAFADKICPYSNALRNNVKVAITVKTSP